ncbi:hypothetical protein PVMG_05809 [Plasmodium vivax Mauritania I]|uniref:Variable surface protein Vir18 n=1 Tax=Plasmodium vivax Mauritania I TaxID=1035515 RepID=A0A0J9TL67_PLAVI|nr:hypothetical protein PVMG_05809 [Plasmodium vivax Mauritania I]
MAWPYRGYNRIINTYQQYYAAPCLNSYSTLKRDIYEKIDSFYNGTHENIYNEWHQLYKYINAKNDSIKHCVDKRYINSDFSKDEKINNFKSICNNRGECRINVESNINKNSPLKRAVTAEPCKGRKNCLPETTGKVKLRSQLNGEPSKVTHLHRPKVQKITLEHAGRDESNKQSEVDQSDLKTRLNSIKSKVDEPELVTNKQSSISVQGRTSTQAFPETEDIPPIELNPQAKDSPSKGSFAGESDARGTLQVSNLGISLLQNNLTDDQTLDANSRNVQTHPGGGVEKQDRNHQIYTTEHSDRVSLLGSDSAPEKLDNEDSVDRDNNGSCNNVEAHVLEDAIPLDAEKENVVIAPAVGVSSVDASLSPETSDDEAAHGGFNGDEGAFNAGALSAEKGNEVDTNNGNILDTLSEFLNGIQSNPQIIKTSMPIGIALLLGLLFKYTPLWRVLTKKNRKKGASINEELNSVLQEPSIMDDESSIPFSYGAFEYSIFDQNSY